VTGQGKVVPVLHEALDHEGKWWIGTTGLHTLNLSTRWMKVVSYSPFTLGG